jgi:hypothetical protein
LMRLRQAAERENGKAAANAVKRELMRITAARENARAQGAAAAFASSKKSPSNRQPSAIGTGLHYYPRALVSRAWSCSNRRSSQRLADHNETHSQGRFSGRRFGNTVSPGHQIDSQGCGPSPGRDFF